MRAVKGWAMYKMKREHAYAVLGFWHYSCWLRQALNSCFEMITHPAY